MGLRRSPGVGYAFDSNVALFESLGQVVPDDWLLFGDMDGNTISKEGVVTVLEEYVVQSGGGRPPQW